MKVKAKKILIVEDEESVIYALTERLELVGSTKVVCATDGVEGLKMVVKEKPDLMLLDIILPKMDGIKMLEKLRQDKWGKNALVIILSNLSDPRKEQEAKELGVENYIIKVDWNIEDIVKLVFKKLST